MRHRGWLSVEFHAILILPIEVGDSMLNYANLNDMEFEALCRDVMERMLGVSLRRFGPGKDGGVDLTTRQICKANGADVLVAGSAFYGAADRAAFVAAIEK